MRIATLSPSEHDFSVKNGLRSGAHLLVTAEIAHQRHQSILPKRPFSAGTDVLNHSDNAVSGSSSPSSRSRTPEQEQEQVQEEHPRSEAGQIQNQSQTQQHLHPYLRPTQTQSPPQQHHLLHQHVDHHTITVCHPLTSDASYPPRAGCNRWQHPCMVWPVCTLPKNVSCLDINLRFFFLLAVC